MLQRWLILLLIFIQIFPLLFIKIQFHFHLLMAIGRSLFKIFAALPLGTAFGILAKMPNWLLARNVRKMLKSVEMAMKNNNWNKADCGRKLTISEDGRVVKHRGPDFGWNAVRAKLPLPKFNLDAIKSSIAYFERWHSHWIHPAMSNKSNLPPIENSIGMWHKDSIRIDGKGINFGNGGGRFKVNDVIGIGIAYFPNNLTMKCFASCNGQLLGMAELPEKFAALQIFPAISMIYPNDAIRANFGTDPWCYNPLEFVNEKKRQQPRRKK